MRYLITGGSGYIGTCLDRNQFVLLCRHDQNFIARASAAKGKPRGARPSQNPQVVATRGCDERDYTLSSDADSALSVNGSH